MENSQGNCENPPRSLTTDGTEVAMMVLSRATSAVLSMRAVSTGPRSERKPTPRDGAAEVVVTWRTFHRSGHARGPVAAPDDVTGPEDPQPAADPNNSPWQDAATWARVLSG